MRRIIDVDTAYSSKSGYNTIPTRLQGYTLSYNTSSLDGRKYSSHAFEDWKRGCISHYISTSSDDDDFEDIEYVSLEEVNDIDQEEKEFDLEDIL
ncbi:hypothetical protein Tco_0825124 [Tanacetum coccineum]